MDAARPRTAEQEVERIEREEKRAASPFFPQNTIVTATARMLVRRGIAVATGAKLTRLQNLVTSGLQTLADTPRRIAIGAMFSGGAGGSRITGMKADPAGKIQLIVETGPKRQEIPAPEGPVIVLIPDNTFQYKPTEIAPDYGFLYDQLYATYQALLEAQAVMKPPKPKPEVNLSPDPTIAF